MHKQGKVGILLVFIVVIVIGLGVASSLITRTNKLTEDTFTSTQQVRGHSNILQVVQVIGFDGSAGILDFISLTIRPSPGAEPYYLEDLVVLTQTRQNSSNYQYAGTSLTSRDEANTTHYVVEYLQRGTRHSPGRLNHDDLIQVHLQLPQGITGDELLTVRFIPKSSTETVKQVVAPHIIPGQQEVQLYPQV